MAFPQVSEITETSISSASTSHVITLPGTTATDNLLLLFHSCFQSAGSVSITGWTQVYQNFRAAHSSWCYARKVDGTEGGSITVSLGNSRAGAAQVYQIYDWGGTIGTDIASAVFFLSSGTSWNPPSLTSGFGAVDALWIAAAHTGDDDIAVTAYPTNYTNGTDTSCGAGANASGRVATARRELNAASEDPGPFTGASSEEQSNYTVAIEDGVAGSDPVAAEDPFFQNRISEIERGRGGVTVTHLGGVLVE